MKSKIEFKKIKYNEIKDSFFKSFWDKYDNVNESNIEVKFGSVDEINPGRPVLRFTLLENGIDITNKISSQGFCSPIRLNFINKKNNLLYFPFEGYFIFYNIESKQIKKINYNSRGRIYEINNCIIILKDNGYTKIDLDNLESNDYIQDNANFVYPLENQDIIIFNNFLNYKYSTSKSSNSLQIEISTLYDTSFNKFLDKSFKDSQKGYLWSNGIKVKNNEPFHLSRNEWCFIGYDKESKDFVIGTQIITNEGKLNNLTKTMVFNAENKYLRIKLLK